MDIEWAKDGKTGELFIVQARPETVHSQESHNIIETYHLQKRGEVILEGRSVGEKIATGRPHVIKNVHDLGLLKQGEILVADVLKYLSVLHGSINI